MTSQVEGSSEARDGTGASARSDSQLRLVSSTNVEPTVTQILEDEHGVTAKAGQKCRCPKCGHNTGSVTRNNKLLTCFHPGCRFKIRAWEHASKVSPLAQIHERFFKACNKALDDRQPESKASWAYLQERRVEPEVARLTLGVVPSNAVELINELFKPHIEKAKTLVEHEAEGGTAKKQSKQKKPSDAEKGLKLLEDAQAKLLGCVQKKNNTVSVGDLVFPYRDQFGQIQSLRFRKPVVTKIKAEKGFRLYAPTKRRGVFGADLYSLTTVGNNNQKPVLFVVEGEFNALQLWSALQRVAKAHNISEPTYYWACAVGSARDIDTETLQGLNGSVLAIYDNDDAGNGFVNTLKEACHLEKVTTPNQDSDLDEFLVAYADDPEKGLQALRDLIAQRVFEERGYKSLMLEIVNIRREQGSSLKQFEAFARVAGLIIRDMLDGRTRFLHDDQHAYLFYRGSKTLVRIDEKEALFKQAMSHYGINGSEGIYSYIYEALLSTALESGTKTRVYRFAHYRQETNTLYVFNLDNGIYRITSTRVEFVDNGTDGVLFLRNPIHKPFKAEIQHRPTTRLLSEVIFNQVNFDTEKLTSAEIEEHRFLLWLWVLALFFPELLPTRPIICFLGEKGSGKSITVRKLLKLFLGLYADLVTVSEEKDFDANLTNRHFMGVDNVDRKIDWLEDKLAIAATGGTLAIRELYRTNVLVEFPVDCFLAVTSRTPQFRRDDVADRLLIMRVERFEKFRSERRVLEEVLLHRNKLWTELLFSLQFVVKALERANEDEKTFTERLADFSDFASTVVSHTPCLSTLNLNRIFEGVTGEQDGFALEEDKDFTLLCKWVEKPQNHGKPVTNGALLAELRLLSVEEHTPLKYDDTRSFSQHMRHIRSNLKKFFRIEETPLSHGRGKELRFWPKVQGQGVNEGW